MATELAPTVVENFPAGQGVQLVAPEEDEYVPAAQGVHDPPFTYVPAAQGDGVGAGVGAGVMMDS